jgi:hypothetical protein
MTKKNEYACIDCINQLYIQNPLQTVLPAADCFIKTLKPI